jgi:hypothetical protein
MVTSPDAGFSARKAVLLCNHCKVLFLFNAQISDKGSLETWLVQFSMKCSSEGGENW